MIRTAAALGKLMFSQYVYLYNIFLAQVTLMTTMRIFRLSRPLNM